MLLAQYMCCSPSMEVQIEETVIFAKTVYGVYRQRDPAVGFGAQLIGPIQLIDCVTFLDIKSRDSYNPFLPTAILL